MDIGSTSKYGGNPHSAALLLLLHTTVPQQLAKHDRSLDRSLDWSDRAGEPMGRVGSLLATPTFAGGGHAPAFECWPAS